MNTTRYLKFKIASLIVVPEFVIVTNADELEDKVSVVIVPSVIVADVPLVPLVSLVPVAPVAPTGTPKVIFQILFKLVAIDNT